MKTPRPRRRAEPSQFARRARRRIVSARAAVSGLLSIAVSLGCGGARPRSSPPAPSAPAPGAAPAPPASVQVAPAKVTELAARVIRTHRLGDVSFVSYVASERGADVVHVARVGDDGGLRDVATGVPPSRMETTRGGGLTLSGTPSALLGEPDGPIWMAFTHYNVFGDAVVYRAERGAWRCVGRCAARPDLEAWGPWIEAPGPGGEPAPRGDLVAERSRGHLFRVANRVSNEGDAYVLPRAGASPGDAVRRIAPLAASAPVELADGSIVDAGALVPDRSVRAADGRSRDDLWVLTDEALVHVRGDRRDRVALPSADVAHLVVGVDGSVWLSGGATSFRRDEPADEWRAARLAGASPVEVVAAGPTAVLAVAGDRLLRAPRW